MVSGDIRGPPLHRLGQIADEALADVVIDRGQDQVSGGLWIELEQQRQHIVGVLAIGVDTVMRRVVAAPHVAGLAQQEDPIHDRMRRQAGIRIEGETAGVVARAHACTPSSLARSHLASRRFNH